MFVPLLLDRRLWFLWFIGNSFRLALFIHTSAAYKLLVPWLYTLLLSTFSGVWLLEIRQSPSTSVRTTIILGTIHRYIIMYLHFWHKELLTYMELMILFFNNWCGILVIYIIIINILRCQTLGDLTMPWYWVRTTIIPGLYIHISQDFTTLSTRYYFLACWWVFSLIFGAYFIFTIDIWVSMQKISWRFENTLGDLTMLWYLWLMLWYWWLYRYWRV